MATLGVAELLSSLAKSAGRRERQRTSFQDTGIRTLAFLGLLLACAACTVSPTTYEDRDHSWETGVSAEPLDNDQFEIVAAGNFETPRRTIEEFGLLKAAETAVENQADVFRVVDARIEQATQYLYGQPYNRAYTLTMVIEVADREELGTNADKYQDAQGVIDTLGPKHKTPDPS